jgi:hypothetical protein
MVLWSRKTMHGSINSPIGSDESTMIASYVPSEAFLKNSTAESRRKTILVKLQFKKKYLPISKTNRNLQQISKNNVLIMASWNYRHTIANMKLNTRIFKSNRQVWEEIFANLQSSDLYQQSIIKQL